MGPERRRQPGSVVLNKPAGRGPAKAGLAARQAATRLLAAVIDAKTPLDGLTDPDTGHPMFRALEARDRALTRAILVSALRHRRAIDRLVAARLQRSLPANARSLLHILHVGIAQILLLDIPDSAAVDLAVEQARADPRAARFAKLVNAVLRAIARDREAALAVVAGTPAAPDWFAERLAATYGAERAARILDMHRHEAPVDFTPRGDAGEWAGRLGGVLLPTGSVRVERLAASVPDLPGFAEGAWWVQDAAAALPARLFGDVAGLSVADLCAAPGGKTAQLAVAGANVTAVEKSPARMRRLAANLGRLGLDARLVEADLFDWEPEAPFDAVLLDAPCSSTGTVRRHPDIPWTKGPEDIARLAALQGRMLARAMELVAPGGLVVFSNCSLDPLEGEAMVADFLAGRGDVARVPVGEGEFPRLDGFISPDGALRTTPADLDLGRPEISGMDGFYAVRLKRTH